MERLDSTLNLENNKKEVLDTYEKALVINTLKRDITFYKRKDSKVTKSNAFQ